MRRNKIREYDIERALVMRREEVPPVDRFLPAVAAPLVRPRLRRVLDAVVSPPAMMSIGFVWAGALAFAYGDAIAGFLSTLADTSRLEKVIDAASGASELVLASVYVGLTIVILLSTGIVTARFLRDSH